MSNANITKEEIIAIFPKVAETMALANKAQFPLLCTMEPE